MKAILVMEMPENCLECSLEIGVEDTSGSKWKGNICRGCGKKNADWSKKPEWCPLIPMPERKIAVPGYEAHIASKGWNACLDAMEGGGRK